MNNNKYEIISFYLFWGILFSGVILYSLFTNIDKRKYEDYISSSLSGTLSNIHHSLKSNQELLDKVINSGEINNEISKTLLLNYTTVLDSYNNLRNIATYFNEGKFKNVNTHKTKLENAGTIIEYLNQLYYVRINNGKYVLNELDMLEFKEMKYLNEKWLLLLEENNINSTSNGQMVLSDRLFNPLEYDDYINITIGLVEIDGYKTFRETRKQ